MLSQLNSNPYAKEKNTFTSYLKETYEHTNLDMTSSTTS